MTYRELMKALSGGKKLRFKEWPEEMYIFMNENDEIEDNEGVQIKKDRYGAVLRGGDWGNLSGSGVFYAYLSGGSSDSPNGIGFRYFDEWEIVKPKKKIKLYRYTYKSPYLNDHIYETNFMSKAWEDFMDKDDILLKTEEKTIEVDDE